MTLGLLFRHPLAEFFAALFGQRDSESRNMRPGSANSARTGSLGKEHHEMSREELEQETEEVLNTLGDAILRLAFSYLHNREDAEDILQETLIKFVTSRPVFENEKHRKAWLMTVAANLSKNRIEYNRVRDTAELNEEIAGAAEEDCDIPEGAARVWKAVESLPVNQREAIHLFYQEGYQTAEIAAITGRKEATVRSDLKRGRDKLKELLKGADDFE